MNAQARLLDVPMAGVYPLAIAEANALLVRWEHRLGPCNRPFRQEAYALEVDGQAVAVAISASIVPGATAGYRRDEVVELARLGASQPWANRIMLRFWRELCAPRWKSWPVKAAVSYSKNAWHPGNLYRFDGWEKIREDAGNANPGKHGWSSASRRPGGSDYGTPALVGGAKTLWLWRYETADGSSASS